MAKNVLARSGHVALVTIGALAELEPRVLLPGHGRPLTTGSAAALAALAQGCRRVHRRRGRQRLVPRTAAGTGTGHHHGCTPGCSGWASP